MKKLILLSALLATNAIALTDLEIVQNYKTYTKSQEKCKQYIVDAFDAEKEIKAAQKAMSDHFNKVTKGGRNSNNTVNIYSIDSDRNNAMNDYVDAAVGISKTCPSSNSEEIKNITETIRSMAVLRQRILLGLE